MSSSIAKMPSRRPRRSRRARTSFRPLNDLDWKGAGKSVSVRINGLDTHYMYRDVVDIVEQAGANLDTISHPQGWRPGRRLYR